MSGNGNSADVQTHIDREIQRRVALNNRRHADEVTELRSIIQQCQTSLIHQNNVISRLTSGALTFGTLVKVHNFPDPQKFKTNDEVLVVDRTSSHFEKGGHIVSGVNNAPVVDEDGYVIVKLIEGIEEKFLIGMEGKGDAQIRLSQKDDGTYAIVSADGKLWEVRGVSDLSLNPGDPVKIMPDSKAIVAKGCDLRVGPICHVSAILTDCVEISHKGEKQLVRNPRNLSLEEGDRIVTDPEMYNIIQKLPSESSKRYLLSQEPTLTWDDIGGLHNAKQDLRDALEFQVKNQKLYDFYKMKPFRGVLLWGPPGNGKTLLARAAAWSLSQMYGKKATESGYYYVKGPEILDKWLGNSEKEIRSLVDRCRRHYRTHGYKAVLVIDEADAILPVRGLRRSSDISDTLVPMFLSEMDGADAKQTEENPFFFLLTNRPDTLDPAITRPGRISRHIKIDRPTDETSIDILKIHTRGLPFQEGPSSEMNILTICAMDLFSKSRLLYRVNGEHDFTLADCVNGAMLENIVEIAKQNASRRDQVTNEETGLVVDDFRLAVQTVYREQKGQNHQYDLIDFAERLGLQPESMKYDRCFSMA